MSKIVYTLATVLFLGGFTSSCIKDNNDDQLIKNEQILLDKYILTNNITTKPTESGLYFLLKDTGNGEKPVINDYVLINYTKELIDGTIIETDNLVIADKNKILPSISVGGPMLWHVTSDYIQGLVEGIQMMHEGDSAMLIIPSKIAYWSFYSSLMPPYSTLIYKIRLKKVIKDIKAYDQANIDSTVIKIFKMKLTDSVAQNLYVKIDTSGTGYKIQTDTTVTINYKGSFLDGRMFTPKDSMKTYSFTMGTTATIEGFNIAFNGLKKGTKARIIIPYPYAYGEDGALDKQTWQVLIPPYSSLLFEVEIQNK